MNVPFRLDVVGQAMPARREKEPADRSACAMEIAEIPTEAAAIATSFFTMFRPPYSDRALLNP
jgi:hypothetical protein